MFHITQSNNSSLKTDCRHRFGAFNIDKSKIPLGFDVELPNL